MKITKVSIPLGTRERGNSGEKLMVEINSAGPIVLAGPNGAGKSAFMHDLFKLTAQAGYGGDWLPAHRTITFGSDQYVVSSAEADINLSKRLSWETQDDGRYRQKRGENHLKSVVQRLVDIENQRNRDFRDRAREDYAHAGAVDVEVGSALDDLNRIFESGTLPVRFVLDRGLISAIKGDDTYGLPLLSDGERAALLLAISFMSLRSGDVIYVDEPERHLNPAIAQPLLRTLVDYASGSAVVLASHDLDLLEGINPQKFFVLKDSVPKIWYDLEEVDLADVGVLDSAKKLVLGGRRKVLLIEGDRGSLDVNLYPYVYPGWTVEPAGGWEAVVGRVTGLKQNPKWSWVEPRGLIDLDGRTSAEVETLKGRGIFAIPTPSVESLFLLSSIMGPIAELKHASEGGDTKDERLSKASIDGIAALYKDIDDLASRVAAWRFGRLVSANKPSASDIKTGNAKTVNVDPTELYSNAKNELIALKNSDSCFDVHVKSVPVKPTGATSAVAKALGFPSFSAYAQAVFHHLAINSAAGQSILEALKAELPELAA